MILRGIGCRLHPRLIFTNRTPTRFAMAAPATPPTSRTLVRKAGNILARELPVPQSEEEKSELAYWFGIAHQWRRAHLIPMNSIRAELRYRARQRQADAVVVGRLKRMSSIRRKLRGRSLHQIQDIGGCRAIFEEMEVARTVVDGYLSGDSRHELIGHDDYTDAPKSDGYRSTHLVLRFDGGRRREAYDGLRIEIQIRTQLQHAWATAVEAVGLYRREDLKFGRGDAKWLRFFQLMSSEMALAEGMPLVPGCPTDKQPRRHELDILNSEIGAIDTLESFRHAIRKTESTGRPRTKFYLIQFEDETRTVTVRPYANAIAGSSDFEAEELKADPKNAVLVEVDRMEDLKEAYPNYFLDVALFTTGVQEVLAGRDVAIPRQPPATGWKSNLAAILREWKQRR